MTPIPAAKLSTKPGLRVGEVHTVLASAEPGAAAVDVVAATDSGQPAVAIWAGDGQEPAVMPVSAIPALIERLAAAALDATT